MANNSKTVSIMRIDIEQSFNQFLATCYDGVEIAKDQKDALKQTFICGMKLGFEASLEIGASDDNEETCMLAIGQLGTDINEAFLRANLEARQ
jgi:hypothetical protein